MKYSILLFLLLPYFLFSQTFRKKYHGNIGPYPITLTLVSKSGNLNGTYYYDSFDDPISIRGYVTGKSIRFHGFDLKGNMIDEFIGQLNKYDIQGIWIGEGMQKKYPFSLKEVYVPPPPLVRFFSIERVLLILLGLIITGAAALYIYIRRTKKVPRWLNKVELQFMRLFTPQRIGYQFERYMTDRLDPGKYHLVEWRNFSKKKFKLSTYSPGLVFEFKNAGGERSRFGISCRFFEKAEGDKLLLGKETVKFDRDKEVFVAVGIGGKPSAPESVYLIPIENVKGNIVSLKDIAGFKIQGATVEYDPGKKIIA